MCATVDYRLFDQLCIIYLFIYSRLFIVIYSIVFYL